MDLGGEHVRFPEQSGHALCARRCPLVTQSGNLFLGPTLLAT